MQVKVCAIQDSPVFFDKGASLDKVEHLTSAYAAQGCDLIVFPESFVPGYPRGFDFGAVVGSRTDEGRSLFAEYASQSVVASGSDIKRLVECAAANNIYIVLGVTERDAISGTLYCSVLYISPTDGLMGVHRKVKPTGTERVIWGEGDGSDLVTCRTRIGVLGGLICWENYMPLARQSMYIKGVQIYIAPTADARESWTSTMKQIALEGRCFVVGCNQFFEKSMYAPKYSDQLTGGPEIICRGGSIIVSPLGEVLAGPLYDESGALVATLDLEEISRSKLDFDGVGHYSRDDIFKYESIGQPDTYVERDIENK